VRIAHLADIHFGREDWPALEAARDVVKSTGVEAIIVAGDLTQRGKRSEFTAAREYLDSFDLPVMCVPGNHDTPLLNVHARATAPFDRYGAYMEGMTEPLEIKGISVRGLNTARGWQARRNWAEGSVNLAALRSVLDDWEGEHAARMLVCHHPFVPPARAPLQTTTRRGAVASRQLMRSSVNLLLTGHVHTPHAEVISGEEGGYIVITAGTLSTRLRQEPPAFNLIDVVGDEVTLSVQAFEGGAFSEKAHGVWHADTLEPVHTPRVLSITENEGKTRCATP